MSVKNLQVLVLMLGLGLSSKLYAKESNPYKVSNINLVTNGQAVVGHEAAPFLSVLGFRKERAYTEHDILDGVKRLEEVFPYRVERWAIDQKTSQLVLDMRRKNKIRSISASGNEKISSSKIIDSTGRRLVGAYCEDVCDSILERVRRFYTDQGFYDFDVKLHKDYGPDNDVDITLKINEGKPTIIENIDLEVDGYVSVERLRKILNVEPGQRMISSVINKRIRNLRTHLYDNAYYSASFFRNNIEVSEDKRTAKVELGIRTGPKFFMVFEGNDVFSSFHVLKRALEISETDVITREYYPVLIRRLEDFYRSHGFSDVRISISERLGQDVGELVLIFDINEGTQKYLGRLRFNLPDNEQERRLMRYLRDENREFFSKRFFVRRKIEDMKESIERFFNEEGYLRVRIIDIKYESRSPHIMDVSYDIDVGRPTLIRSINVHGNSVFSDEHILKELGIERGGSVYIPRFSEGLDRITFAHREMGYVDFSLDRQRIFSYSDDFRFVDINIILREGSRYRVGRIFIQGLKDTKERVVTRELRFKQGGDLDLYQVQYSENELSRLSVFSTVSLIVLPSSVKGEGYRDIMINVEEKKAGVYELGFGYRTDRGIMVSSDIIYHNLGGWNRTISTGASVSRRLDNRFRFVEYELRAGYYEPYLFNIPFDFRTDVEFKKEDLPDYGRKKLDLAFYFEKRIGNNYLILRQALERVNIFGSRIQADDSVYWKYSIRPTYRFDNRDSFFNPTRGTYFMAFAEWGHSLSGDVVVNYIKLVQRTRLYFSFLRDWTFVIAADTGYVKGLRGGVVLQDERFAMGGVDSIRGYRWRVINDRTPRLPYQYYYTLTAELRRRLFWRLVGSVFHDYGNLYSQDPQVQGPFSSVGTGLSLLLPVGAISLQYGYIYEPSKRIPPNRFGRIHFSIGTF